MVTIVENGYDEAVSISHSADTIRKGMYPIILSPAMGK